MLDLFNLKSYIYLKNDVNGAFEIELNLAADHKITQGLPYIKVRNKRLATNTKFSEKNLSKKIPRQRKRLLSSRSSVKSTIR